MEIKPAKGGSRPGAGRKKGVPNKRTRELKAVVETATVKAASEGILPADLLLTLARMRWDEAHKAVASAAELIPEGVTNLELLDDEKRKEIERRKLAARKAFEDAQSAAIAAAPYFHARLANVNVDQKGDVFVYVKQYTEEEKK